MVVGEHSRQEPFEQLVSSYWEHLHISKQSVQNACNIVPHAVHELHEHTWTLMNISKAAASCQDISSCKSTHSLSKRTDHVGVTTVKILDQGHLHPKLEVPGLTWPGRESNRGLHGGRGALSKRAIRTAIRNIYIWAREQWIILATSFNSKN